MSLEIVSRGMWNATPPKADHNMVDVERPVRNVFITNTYTSECDNLRYCKGVLKTLQDRAMRLRNIDDIFYSFMIGADGRVYEGRGFNYTSSLPMRFKYLASNSVYIAFIGSFQDKRPSDKARRAKYQLIQYGLATDNIHQEYRETTVMARDNRRRGYNIKAPTISHKTRDNYNF